MCRRMTTHAVLFLLLLQGSPRGQCAEQQVTARAALQPFNDLIGSWRATGTPEGTQAEKQRGFWTESITWCWRFKGDDAWLAVTFDKGKYFTSGELHRADMNRYRLSLKDTTGHDLVFLGSLKGKQLTLESVDPSGVTQRLVLSLLHANRFMYRYELKPMGRELFSRLCQVGATKVGEPFASENSGGPECIVSGGMGTIAVTYKGETYQVCCTGCRDEFKANPEKYLKEAAARRVKKTTGKD